MCKYKFRINCINLHQLWFIAYTCNTYSKGQNKPIWNRDGTGTAPGEHIKVFKLNYLSLPFDGNNNETSDDLDRFAKTNADLIAGIASDFCSQARTAINNSNERQQKQAEVIYDISINKKIQQIHLQYSAVQG